LWCSGGVVYVASIFAAAARPLSRSPRVVSGGLPRTSGRPIALRSSGSIWTACGTSSYSTSIRRAACCARSSVSATTTAIGWSA
jgi:hypothetical protein